MVEASQISINIDKTTLHLGESIDISGVVESASCTLGYCMDINYNPVIIVISNTSTGEYYNFTVNSALVPFAAYNYKYLFTPPNEGNYDVFAEFPGNANFDVSDSITAHFTVAAALPPPATCLREGEYDYVGSGLNCCPGLHRDGYLSGYCVKDVTTPPPQPPAGCVPVTRRCETPLNGYDTDGCTRRVNAACNPTTTPPPQPPQPPGTEPPYTEIAIVAAGLIAAALILKKKE